MVIVSYFLQHRYLLLLLLALLVVCILVLLFSIRNSIKRDMLSAKPLSLSEEEIRRSKMRFSYFRKYYLFTIPAKYATEEVINAWTDSIASRLGDGYSSSQMVTKAHRFWHPAQYQITFSKLGSLR